ncbi:hypothetical protein ACO0QE_003565 [Hanseniaspora vineae]
MTTPWIMGHRGFKEDPNIKENTLPAFEKALETKSVDIIETDIQMTKDGVLVINHDQTTKRIYTKDCTINNVSYEQLKKLVPRGMGEGERVRMMSVREFLKYIYKSKANKVSKGSTDRESIDRASTERESIGKSLDTESTNASASPGMKIIFDFKKNLDPIVFIKFYNLLLELSDELGPKWWHDKVYLGIWCLEHLEFGYIHSNMFQQFKIINISVSLEYSLRLSNWLVQHGLKPFEAVSMNFVAIWNDSPQQRQLKKDFPKETKLVVWTVNNLSIWEYTCQYIDKLQWDVLAICTDKPVCFKEYYENRKNTQVKSLAQWKVVLLKAVYKTILFMLFNKWCQLNLVGFINKLIWGREIYVSVHSLFLGLLRMVFE